MAQEFTLEQLQKMGGKPLNSNQKEFSIEELQQAGGVPIGPKIDLAPQKEPSVWDTNPILKSIFSGVSAFGSSAKEQLGNLGELYGGGENSIGAKLGRDIQSGADDMAKGDYIKGAAKSGLRTAGDVAGTIFAPLGAVLGTVLGAANKAVPRAGEIIDKGINRVADKISDIKPVQDFSVKHPNAGEDFNRLLNIILAAGEKTPITTKGMKEASNFLADVAGGGKNTAQPGMVKEAIQPVKDTLNIVKKVAPDSATIMQRVARIPKAKQASFEKTAGESVGSYLVNRGIYGNVEKISEQLYKRFDASKATADNALAQLGGEYKSTPVKTALDELYARETRVSAPGALSKDISRVSELINKYKKNGLTMSEINEVKRMYERNVKLDYLKQNLPENVARANNIDNAIRVWQFKQANYLGLKNLPEINKETRLAKQLLDDIGKEYSGVAGNNAITLTDWIMLSGGNAAALAGFLTKKGVSSKSFQSGLAKLFGGKPKVEEPKAKFETRGPQLALPKPAIRPPMPTDKSGIKVLPAKKGIPFRDPKTGQMRRRYVSE